MDTPVPPKNMTTYINLSAFGKTTVFAITLLTSHSCLVVSAPTPLPIPVDLDETETRVQAPKVEKKTCYPENFEEIQVSEASKDSSSLEATADKLAAAGKHKEAIQKYIEAGKTLVDETEADGRMAELEVSAMFGGGTVEDFQNENRAIFQNQAETKFKMGRSYTQLGKWEVAIDCFDRVINGGILPPNDAIAYLNRGNAHERMGVKDKARADFQQATNLFKKYKLPSYEKLAQKRLLAATKK
jgi:tetratricopeptide (TPR) repeat protein